MKYNSNKEIVLAPTDLSKHLSCQHLTFQNIAALISGQKPPFRPSPVLETLQELGNQHEQDYLKFLKEQGLSIAEPSQSNSSTWVQEAISNEVDVIYHPMLSNDKWSGEADFLIKRERNGQTLYEVYDTKLARKTRAQTLLQLYVYSILLDELNDHDPLKKPEYMYVVTPNSLDEPEPYRIDDFAAYLRYLGTDLYQFIDEPQDVYPELLPFCDFCNYWTTCESRRRTDDYLGFVAGINTSQRLALEESGINTLEKLAKAPELPNLSSSSYSSLQRMQKQAELQLKARETNTPVFELKKIPEDEPHGLSLLPKPTADDIYLDFEGDHFAKEGHVVDYLTGYVTQTGKNYNYTAYWATTPAEEKHAFENFIDFSVATFKRNPDFHIYHFAPYEETALKRMMTTYSTREIELDLLLSNEVLVDLHQIVKKSIVAGIEKYSLKDLEIFCDFEREQDLKEASQSRRFIESVQSGQFTVDQVTIDAHKLKVENYNREDCLSTLKLQVWLEKIRQSAIDEGFPIERPEKSEAREQQEKPIDREITNLRKDLLKRLPEDLVPTNDNEQAILLLSNLIGYYRREQKANAWEYYRLVNLPVEDYNHESKALAGLSLIETFEDDGKPMVRLSYPPQEVAIKPETAVRLPGMKTAYGYTKAISYTDRTIDIKITNTEYQGYPTNLNFPDRYVTTKNHQDSLHNLAKEVASNGMALTSANRLALSLLLKIPPHQPENSNSVLQQTGESTIATAIRIAKQMDGEVLAIQGPPGAGKTFAGANIILDLVASGKRIGVTAVSNKAIDALLNKVAELADKRNIDLTCYKKGKPPEEYNGPISYSNNQGKLRADLRKEVYVLGGTLWLWCHKWFSESIDCLIVDEAGQMSLANVLAACRSTKNLILLGDPQQLQQPQQASHPDGSDISALEYFSGSNKTMPPEQGLFLAETWRLHPDICKFTSAAFYEDRLSPRERPNDEPYQCIESEYRVSGSGLRYLPVLHAGNQSSSMEEALAVKQLINELEQSTLSLSKATKESKTLTPEDILIITPFNAQIAVLTELLPDYASRIGTVDRFQGQESAVVIYSMASSSAEDAPRGMGFLYDPNRLNVATSRAQILCIVVASAELFKPKCKTPADMAMANGLCVYRELAEELPSLA